MLDLRRPAAIAAVPPPVPSPAPSLPPSPSAPRPELAILRTFFDRLHDAGIRYCHWKSNEHIGPSLVGVSDLDLLVARADAVPLAALLAELGFKRFVVKPGRGYPGIEDYVGFDEATGTLSHLHLHYQLTLGEKFLKGHRLPWEGAVLASRVLDPQHGVFVTDRNLEALLLLVRAAMKLRTRDFLLAAANTAYVRGSQLRELRWLAARTSGPRLQAVATELVGARAAALLPAMLTLAAPTIGQLRAFRRAADPSWTHFRMYSAAGALRRRWWREFATVVGVVRARLQSASLRTSTRTAPQGGVLVAFIGPDGAGKSSLADATTRWLSREVAVVPMYGGSGDGPGSLLRMSLQRLRRLARQGRGRHGPHRDRVDRAVDVAALPGLRAAAYAAWALSLARERRATVRRAQRARDLGFVVIADRYPQRQFDGVNDGPKLTPWAMSPTAWRRWAARREARAYRAAELAPPDLVLKLRVPADIALARKPATPRAQLDRKVAVVDALQFPGTTRVVTLDATLPLAAVLGHAQREIWRAI